MGSAGWHVEDLACLVDALLPAHDRAHPSLEDLEALRLARVQVTGRHRGLAAVGRLHLQEFAIRLGACADEQQRHARGGLNLLALVGHVSASRLRHQAGAMTAPQHKSLRASPCAPKEGRGHAPWHFLYFLPEPHQQGSFRPIRSLSSLTIVSCSGIPPPLPACSSNAASAATSAPAAVATAACPSAEGCSAVPPE